MTGLPVLLSEGSARSRAESLTPEERLLILATYSALDEGEREEATWLAGQVRSWEDFAELALHNATAPLVQSNLERLGLPVPAPLPALTARVREANQARLRIARELFERFARRGIPVVILKGVLFAETIYRNPSYKGMNDVDILVRRGDLDAVYAVYGEMGFFGAAELVGGKPRGQERYSHHAPPFFSRDLKCMVGTHWGLITPLSSYRPDYEAIWSRVQDLDFQGVPAKAMAAEDNLHHLCIHLPYYKTGLRELSDVYNLIRHHRLDWGLFLGEVRKARTQDLVYHALSLSNRVCPSREAEEALRRLEPEVSGWFCRDARRKTASLKRLLRSRSTHISLIEKAFADLRATRRASERWSAFLRMWGGMLLVPGADAARMNALERPTLRARLAAPGRIRRVFYRDVGRLFFWVIMAKCALEVARATLLAPFRREEDGHAAFAEKLGVSPADLQRLKEALE